MSASSTLAELSTSRIDVQVMKARHAEQTRGEVPAQLVST